MYKCNREVLTTEELSKEPPTPTLHPPHNKNEVIV